MNEDEVRTADRNLDESLDEDGFLKTMASWDRSAAQTLAERNDLGPLTARPWAVVEFVKDLRHYLLGHNFIMSLRTDHQRCKTETEKIYKNRNRKVSVSKTETDSFRFFFQFT